MFYPQSRNHFLDSFKLRSVIQRFLLQQGCLLIQIILKLLLAFSLSSLYCHHALLLINQQVKLFCSKDTHYRLPITFIKGPILFFFYRLQEKFFCLQNKLHRTLKLVVNTRAMPFDLKLVFILATILYKGAQNNSILKMIEHIHKRQARTEIPKQQSLQVL